MAYPRGRRVLTARPASAVRTVDKCLQELLKRHPSLMKKDFEKLAADQGLRRNKGLALLVWTSSRRTEVVSQRPSTQKQVLGTLGAWRSRSKNGKFFHSFSTGVSRRRIRTDFKAVAHLARRLPQRKHGALPYSLACSSSWCSDPWDLWSISCIRSDPTVGCRCNHPDGVDSNVHARCPNRRKDQDLAEEERFALARGTMEGVKPCGGEALYVHEARAGNVR